MKKAERTLPTKNCIGNPVTSPVSKDVSMLEAAQRNMAQSFAIRRAVVGAQGTGKTHFIINEIIDRLPHNPQSLRIIDIGGGDSEYAGLVKSSQIYTGRNVYDYEHGHPLLTKKQIQSDIENMASLDATRGSLFIFESIWKIIQTNRDWFWFEDVVLKYDMNFIITSHTFNKIKQKACIDFYYIIGYPADADKGRFKSTNNPFVYWVPEYQPPFKHRKKKK